METKPEIKLTPQQAEIILEMLRISMFLASRVVNDIGRDIAVQLAELKKKACAQP